MSKTDKLGRNRDRAADGWIVNGALVSAKIRNQLLPSKRDAIAEQLTDESPVEAIVERPKPRKQPKPVIQRYVAPNVRLSATRIGTRHEGTQRPTPSNGSIPRIGASQGKHFAHLDVETPSIHHMAQARAKALGMVS